MMKPTKLLEDLGVVGRVVENSLIRGFGAIKLQRLSINSAWHFAMKAATYVFLLFVNMADLEPDVLLGQGSGRRVDNVLEALFGHMC